MSKQGNDLLDVLWAEFDYAHELYNAQQIPSEYKDLFKPGKQYFLHLTNSKGYTKIMRSKKLMPSGGCLVGSLYCTPLFKERDRFRLHNLGAYLYAKEMPKGSDNKPVKGFIIELNITHRELIPIGINYLKLGKLHNVLYEKYSFLLSQNEKNDISQKLTKEQNELEEFWNHYGESENETFFRKFEKLVSDSHILGYLYFESVYQYIVENQTTDISKHYKEKYNEIYNWHAKDLMFAVHPDFATRFTLKNFHSPIAKIFSKIIELGFLGNLDQEIFFNAIRESLKISIQELLVRDSYSYFQGHILHRIIRTTKRYSDFYIYFDVIKAVEIWNYWCNKRALLPFNNICMKGEIGINPALMIDGLVEYKVYEATISEDRETHGLYYATHNDTALELAISTRMVDPTDSFRRDNQYLTKAKERGEN